MKIRKHLNGKRNILPFAVLFIMVFLNMILFFTACKTESGDNLTLGKRGSISAIVLPVNPDQVVKFAATELQDYIEKMTGARLRIAEPGSFDAQAKAIRFSASGDRGLHWDGFSITVDSTGIVIMANEPRGFLYGAYQFLEDSGCSFVYPGKQEEIVPQLQIIEFMPGKKVYNPVIEHRGLTPYGLQGSSVEPGRDFIDWMAKNKLNYILVSEDRPSDSPGTSTHASIWKEVSGELLPELQKRGFVIEMSEHCTHIFFPRSLFEEHPDWFALNDGERKLGAPPYSGQMCYSNKDAVDYYAARVAEYAADHPEFHVIGTWPLDGGRYCECQGCEDPLTVYNAAKHVAEKVKEVRPDIVVSHLAYQRQTWQPPAEDKIPDNMAVLWCPDTGRLDSLALEWISKSAHAGGTYQFEYLMGDNYRYRANVWLRPRLAVNNVHQAREIGFRGVISLFLPLENWWRSSFNTWFFARACWDPGMDINATLTEYCRKYYGKKAGETEEIFMTIFNELQSEPFLNVSDNAYTNRSAEINPVAARLTGQLDRLIGSSDEPAVTKRLIRIRAYVEFFRLYYESYATRKEGGLQRLVDYTKDNPDLDMVLMEPLYVQWRNSEAFR